MLPNRCGTGTVPIVNVKIFLFFKRIRYLILKLNIELFSEFQFFVEKLGSGSRGQLIMDLVRSATLVLMR
jgi:hypothetical protein